MPVTLELILKNENRLTFVVDEKIAKAMIERHHNSTTFFCIEKNEGLSVDFSDILAVRMKPVPLVKPRVDINKPRPESVAEFPKPEQRENLGDDNESQQPMNILAEDKTKELFKIECKCGAEYFCTLYSDSVKCRCRECDEKVFVDRFAPQVMGDNNRKATIVTNKYHVMAG